MLIKLLSYIPAIIGVIAIGLVLYASDSKNTKNRLFIVVNACIGLWLFFLCIADITQSYSTALWSFRLGLIFSQFMILSFYYFALFFPYKSKINIPMQIIISLPMIALCIILLTPVGIGDIAIDQYGIVTDNAGIIYSLSDFITLAYLLISICVIVTKYKKANSLQRKQIMFVITGLAIATIANIFSNIIVFYSSMIQSYKFVGNFSIFVFSLFVSYAILKHHLFTIRSIVARSVAYMASVTAIIIIYTLLVFTVAKYIFGIELTTTQEIFFATLSAVIAIVYKSVRVFLNKISNKLFYRDAYDGQQFLNTVNTTIVREIDLYNLLNRTAQVVNGNIKTKFCNFYIDQKDSIDFHIAGTDTKVFNKGDGAWDKLFEAIEPKDQKVFEAYPDETDQVSEMMRKLDVDCIAKMVSQDQSVGYLITGPKLSGNTYTKQDFQVLEIVADEVAIAVQNALRYEEIAHFNITLQKKVDDATAELKKTNEKLVALDEAKDEFISMASHQLRTPLTSMKGYVSMVLDGDAGKITKNQKNLLSQAFVSSQRMVYLIADLLNVSRLKTGKFVIDTQPTYLPDVVESEISQLLDTAKARGLEVVFDKPKTFPALNLDETKTRQVIMNFTDNAIYYTPSGGKITIQLKETQNQIEFTVTDTGIGVPKSEQHKLFTKFYRANNAKKARPDGTGLGLFMAKKVILAQGGAIIFNSQEGKGSTFGFSFPREKVEIAKNSQPNVKANVQK